MKKYLLLLLIAVCAVSCGKKDSVGPEGQPTGAIYGKEALRHIAGSYLVLMSQYNLNTEKTDNYTVSIHIEDATSAVRISWKNQVFVLDYECCEWTDYSTKPNLDYRDVGSIIHKAEKLEVSIGLIRKRDGAQEIQGYIRDFDKTNNIQCNFHNDISNQ
ncbi:hypothetical protein [uncultured Alistipes sp.]|jgi:hypothetical protein|uniref:hypothetical protein n=1 Tax=uncultured Alistipes sp. TaxID=538949 RepID=UPI0025EBDAFD|nr:hypothetical protein [uncultured Alistipes sp.]